MQKKDILERNKLIKTRAKVQNKMSREKKMSQNSLKILHGIL